MNTRYLLLVQNPANDETNVCCFDSYDLIAITVTCFLQIFQI
jgi:hypothetical protein